MDRNEVAAQLEKDVGKIVTIGFYENATTPVSASDSRLLVKVPCSDEPEFILVKSMNEYAAGGSMAMGQSFKAGEMNVGSPGSKYRYIVQGSPDNDTQHDPNNIKKLWHNRDMGRGVLGF